jgi:hypothetical protein
MIPATPPSEALVAFLMRALDLLDVMDRRANGTPDREAPTDPEPHNHNLRTFAKTAHQEIVDDSSRKADGNGTDSPWF